MSAFDEVRRSGLFEELARLFPDEASSTSLLEDLDVTPSRMRPFGQMSQNLYWRQVGRSIANGAFVDVTLADLVTCAASHYPDNKILRAAMIVVGASGSDEMGELRVLCLAAGPSDANRLRLQAEHREILLAVRGSRRKVVVILHPAARIDDISLRLLEARPHVVHFGGHGSSDGALIFEDEYGLSAPADIAKLGKLFKAVGGLRGVILSSCYSGAYAEELRDGVEMVAGSPEPLHDSCALALSRHFYRALGDGRTLDGCFDIANAAMDLGDCPPHRLLRAPGSGA